MPLTKGAELEDVGVWPSAANAALVALIILITVEIGFYRKNGISCLLNKTQFAQHLLHSIHLKHYLVYLP